MLIFWGINFDLLTQLTYSIVYAKQLKYLKSVKVIILFGKYVNVQLEILECEICLFIIKLITLQIWNSELKALYKNQIKKKEITLQNNFIYT